METLQGLLVFAVVIVLLYLAGKWNTSDTDHYMGFQNLRSSRKPKMPDAGEDSKKE